MLTSLEVSRDFELYASNTRLVCDSIMLFVKLSGDLAVRFSEFSSWLPVICEEVEGGRPLE
jgi:hypothetical protein